MRAIAILEPQGEPQLIDLPKPAPKADQLLVRVVVSGLNPVDWKQADRAGKGAIPSVSPFVLGVDAAGVVEEIGDAVTRFNIGDRVFGQFHHQPLGEGTDAEYTVVPENGAVASIPDDVDFETAAALPTAGLTALSLIELLNLPAGATILIVGATGGVGSFATQIAAARDLKVIVTASPSEAPRMRDLGASNTIDHNKGDVVAQVKSIAPEGIDALIDLVSDQPRFKDMSQLVRRGGYAFTTIGAADESDLRGKGVNGGNFQVHPTSRLLDRLIAEVQSGIIQVPIEAEISLEQLPDAIARSRKGHSRGKTVIRVAPPDQPLRRSA